MLNTLKYWTRDSKRHFVTLEGGLPYQQEALFLYTSGWGDILLKGTATEYTDVIE